MALFPVTADFTTAGIATNLAANTMTWVLAGVDRISTTSAGAASAAGATAVGLRVDGTIGGETGGVRMLGSATAFNHVLIVGDQGLVFANLGTGVLIGGANATVLNQGSITAQFDGVSSNGANAHIQNHGSILSTFAGAGGNYGIAAAGGGAVIENFGIISSSSQAGAGINLATLAVQLGSRVENHGTIIGFARSVAGSSGDDILINTGLLVGTADLGAGNDLFEGTDGAGTGIWGIRGGVGNDTLRGGIEADLMNGDAGDDLLQGRDGVDTLNGGDGNDRISGMGGSDTVIGGAGNDRLLGFNDDDTLDGGTGADKISGGQGRDVFLFNTIAEIGLAANARDEITDFDARDDQIDLSSIGGLTFIKSQAFGSVAGQVRFDPTKAELQIDLNGDGAADAILDLTAATSLVAQNLLL
jgi:Ca2+-binding RTX toxin-like protein